MVGFGAEEENVRCKRLVENTNIGNFIPFHTIHFFALSKIPSPC